MPALIPSGRPTLGIFGFGPFGQLLARTLAPHARVRVTDPAFAPRPREARAPVAGERSAIEITTPARVCACAIVILAVPVDAIGALCRTIAPHLAPGTLVLDVGSVKVAPAAAMREHLPDHVEIAATHPMFGPQSAADGLRGLKLVVCPLRGRRVLRLAAFLRRTFGLEVILTSPQEHDRQAAYTQGLTHFLAQAMLELEAALDHAADRITTRSFEQLRAAIEIVRHDSPAVRAAIAEANPYARKAREDLLHRLQAVHRHGSRAVARLGGE
ncbi:prephenate dehydrogenase [Novosphingobium sp. 1949]|uniref:Prephenate dehydrogenase n=1 Tax=Novosphingobium organovorum TaxID=2930092 RepID=A0ABT0BGS0_9SPHN|nr:prephenate dehydrogenase [Novosphingobium organovorum]MCJ2184163.1 prephenate dehydrogenase [Novosphingobium organovorum]